MTSTHPRPSTEPSVVRIECGVEEGRLTSLAARVGPPIIFLVVFLIGWQVFVTLDLGQIAMPGPVEVFRSLTGFGWSAEFWGAAAQSALVIGQGLGTGLALGIALGVVVGSVPLLNRSLGPVLYIGYAVPFIAVIPLFLVMFGFGVRGKTSIVFFLVWMTVIIQTVEGIRRIDPTYLEVATAFRTPWWRQWGQINIPAALPYIIVGVRLGIGRALVGTIVAEFSTAMSGLGGVILEKADAYKLADALVAPIFLALVGLTLTGGLKRIEERLAIWKN
jgi:sulfonate transport system permease protein